MESDTSLSKNDQVKNLLNKFQQSEETTIEDLKILDGFVKDGKKNLNEKPKEIELKEEKNDFDEQENQNNQNNQNEFLNKSNIFEKGLRERINFTDSYTQKKNIGRKSLADNYNSKQIMHFNYRVLEYSEPTLIYGYTVEDVKKVDTTTYQLLIPSKEQANGNQINNIRIMYGSMDRMIHLPKECIAATLGTRSIYAFSNNMVYACRYGETTFRAFPVSINITAVLGMITDNRVIVSSDSSIYVIELPM